MPDASFWLCLAILGMTMCLAVVQGRSHERLIRLERKLDFLLRDAGIDPVPAIGEEVIALARDGKKIEAIKRYREMTGVGLAEAKERIEEIGRGS